MEVFAQRRERVLSGLDGVAIVASAPETIRNNDVHNEYRQDSDFFYLTGFEEPDSVLVLSTVHPEHRSVMFVRERDPEREIWDGLRAGVDGVKQRCGVDASYPIGEFAKRLPDYLRGAGRLLLELGRWPRIDRRVMAAIGAVRARGRSLEAWPRDITHPEGVWHEMRLFKDEHELAAMRRAAAITAESHCAAMAMAAPGVHEYQLDARLREIWRHNGSLRHAYPAIVGSGANATILHYRAGDRQLRAGELVLIDAGCEYDYYACDVTRTFPVDGRFSDAQKKVYEVVLAAQLAQLELARPGSDIEAIHSAGARVITEGLVAIGLLKGDVDELIEKESFKRYFMHRSSHWLGMDVHDVGSYFVDGAPRPLQPGMVFTIEPGVYVAANDIEAPEEFRGIGVRIEDDVLITASGHENLTAAIPKTVAEVEAACAG